MSERLFRFQLSELKTARLVCGQCKAVVEVPMDKLALQSQPMRCSVCGQYFTDHEQGNHLHDFARAVQFIVGMADKVHVEFTIPDKTS
jgi:predicted Zn finger-like uncharacterized protein